MRIEEAKGSLAAEKLLEHIREHFGTIPKFCDEQGLDRLKVQKAIKGELVRIDVQFAVSVRDATGGVVDIEDWATPISQGGEA